MAPTGGADIPSSLRFALIAGSSVAAETATFPIDFAKTRMQLHVGRQSFMSALVTAVRNEGVGAVYAGLPPAVMRHVIYSSLRISIYEDFRNWLAGGKNQPTTAGVKAFSGLFAGGISQMVASPADRLKIVLVQEGGKRSLWDVAADITKTEGVKGFYRGVVPNVQRAALVNLGELATYDQAKCFVLQSTGLPDGVAVHTMSAVCSGFVASLCATPADVVKSRMMAGTASGVVSCIQNTIKHEGVMAMWKGFFSKLGTLGSLATDILGHLRVPEAIVRIWHFLDIMKNAKEENALLPVHDLRPVAIS